MLPKGETVWVRMFLQMTQFVHEEAAPYMSLQVWSLTSGRLAGGIMHPDTWIIEAAVKGELGAYR